MLTINDKKAELKKYLKDQLKPMGLEKLHPERYQAGKLPKYSNIKKNDEIEQHHLLRELEGWDKNLLTSLAAYRNLKDKIKKGRLKERSYSRAMWELKEIGKMIKESKAEIKAIESKLR